MTKLIHVFLPTNFFKTTKEIDVTNVNKLLQVISTGYDAIALQDLPNDLLTRFHVIDTLTQIMHKLWQPIQILKIINYFTIRHLDKQIDESNGFFTQF